MHKRISRGFVVLVSIATVALAACGSDEPPESPAGDPGAGSVTEAPVGNACPAEGCTITIVDAAREGGEIAVTWEANFEPDVSKNHIHVYWDTYSADQVSSDAEARGVKQGEWVPTDVVPTYVTESAVAVDTRGDSTVICVTAGDRDHAVIDSSIVDCRDVSDLL
ncbi:MAG: hypothetical protein ACXWZF_06250 [Actinomycetota bacterium]